MLLLYEQHKSVYFRWIYVFSYVGFIHVNGKYRCCSFISAAYYVVTVSVSANEQRNVSEVTAWVCMEAKYRTAWLELGAWLLLLLSFQFHPQ